MKLGILGGTFDPIHCGHLIVAEEVRVRLGLERVTFIPAGEPWLREGGGIASRGHRLQMVRLAIGSNPFFDLSTIELEREGPSYSIDTIIALREELGPGADLYFIIGPDALAQLPLWKEPGRILELCHVVAVRRPEYSPDLASLDSAIPGASARIIHVETPWIEVSSTEVRNRIRDGLSIKYLVPERVEQHIREHGLYLPPSGQKRQKSSDERLLEIVRERAIIRGEFTLSSGLSSPYYFDLRRVTLWPEGAYLVGRRVLELTRGVDAIGGMMIGADPIVASVALVSQMEGRPIPAFIVRKEPKKHGTQNFIEGELPKGSRVAIVDDVITTGGSILRAIEVVEGEGCEVVKVIAILDRKQGGSEELKRRGYDFRALLVADERGEVGLA